MYRTDKQFMKNPATAPSRIYIGAIPKTIIADDLEAKFSKHGKILGLVINSGFAFIQYEFEHEAQKAIRAENGSLLMGRKINVRQATPGKGGIGMSMQNPVPLKYEAPPPQNVPPPIGPPGVPQKEFDNQAEEKMRYEPAKTEDNTVPEEDHDKGPKINPPQKPPTDEERGRNRGNRGNAGGRNLSRERDAFIDRPGTFYGGPRGDYLDNYGPAHGIPAPDILAPHPDRNDCEIIVVSRALTEYAEFIEAKLKLRGLIVDLLFPNEDVPIGRVLANISSRGCLYAILVMPQNEEHRSLTLNILHGIPQEHRNMPIDDALLLISRNFEAYMRGETLPPEDPNKMNLADRHPGPIQMLFNLLAENRMLSTAQYDRIIKYLDERRRLQHEHEVAEGVAPDTQDESSNKQNELQSRILNILNQTSETPIPTSITAPDPTPKEANTPLLKDPSVQKALDSILLGDMFKNIAGGL